MGTTEVRSSHEEISVRFLEEGKVGPPPGLDARRAGDSQVEFELTLPDPLAASDVELTFVTPQGEGTYVLPLAPELPTVLEVEPNLGFRQAQSISVPQLVLGKIERPQDVDVYSVELDADQKIHIEIQSARHGSALDALLTLTDSNGTTLAVHDDLPDSPDAAIEFAVPSTGQYFVIVQDAHDQGGEAHPYRLVITTMEPPVSFIGEVAPLLQRRCVACHGARKLEGGYQIDTYRSLGESGDSGAEGFVAGSLDESESFRRIISEDEVERMPLHGQFLSLAVHVGTDRVAAGSRDGRVVVWELSTGNLVTEFLALPDEEAAEPN